MLYTAIPSTYPKEGIYEYSVIHVDLSCATPGARIHYTIDGSQPSLQSPVYDRSLGLIPLPAIPEGETLDRLRAFAVSENREPSPEAEYRFRIIARKRGHFPHQIMREPSRGRLGLIRVEDFDLDKMYLLIGSERALLIDSGWDETGDLPALCRQLAGGLPVDLIVAHGHPDHVAQIPNFLSAGCRVYLPRADFELAASFCPGLPREQILDIRSGDVLDLGGGSLKVYTVPGHTPGGVVLVDEASGDLFSSDAFGSNRRYVPDSAFLQLSECSAESCLCALRAFRRTAGPLKRIYTGHNDEVLDADSYLDCLERALSGGLEAGESALLPSLRSASESFGSGTVLSDGNWRLDPVWTAANIKFMREADRTASPPRFVRGFTEPPEKFRP